MYRLHNHLLTPLGQQLGQSGFGILGATCNSGGWLANAALIQNNYLRNHEPMPPSIEQQMRTELNEWLKDWDK